MGTARTEKDKETDEEGKKRGMGMERSKAGTIEKRSIESQNYPNWNAIITNIIG